MKVNGDIEKCYHHAYPMQAVLVTCNDQNGKTNIITIAWHTNISKKPPLYAISIAPNRYSYGLIQKNKEFVINFAPFSLVEKVNFCGTHSGRKTDKIKEKKLTLTPAQKIKTPLIKECFAHFECKLNKTISLGDHVLAVGEVVNVLIDENAFKNNLLDISKIQPTYYMGDNVYTTINTKEKKL